LPGKKTFTEYISATWENIGIALAAVCALQVPF